MRDYNDRSRLVAAAGSHCELTSLFIGVRWSEVRDEHEGRNRSSLESTKPSYWVALSVQRRKNREENKSNFKLDWKTWSVIGDYFCRPVTSNDFTDKLNHEGPKSDSLCNFQDGWSCTFLLWRSNTEALWSHIKWHFTDHGRPRQLLSVHFYTSVSHPLSLQFSRPSAPEARFSSSLKGRAVSTSAS